MKVLTCKSNSSHFISTVKKQKTNWKKKKQTNKKINKINNRDINKKSKIKQTNLLSSKLSFSICSFNGNNVNSLLGIIHGKCADTGKTENIPAAFRNCAFPKNLHTRKLVEIASENSKNIEIDKMFQRCWFSEDLNLISGYRT